MKGIFKGLLLLGLMGSAAALSMVMKPTEVIAKRSDFKLASAVPAEFGVWRIDPTVIPLEPAPELKAVLDKTYDQTLSRTYINDQGQRIMLSIAYGGHQGEAMQTHKPEICYPAQGLQTSGEGNSQLHTPYGTLPIRNLVATARNRVEPISYWVIVGDAPTRFGLAYKLQTLKYGLTGKVPDGMLIRISSIGRDVADQYQIHQAFINAMLPSLQPETRRRFVGSTPEKT